MAGVVTTTEVTHRTPKKVKFAWTCGTGASEGEADATTVNVYNGKLVQVTTVPSGAPDAPTADYDLRILDSDGVDLLAGSGADRAAAATEHITFTSLGAVVESQLTLEVTNAGDTKKGTVYVFLV